MGGYIHTDNHAHYNRCSARVGVVAWCRVKGKMSTSSSNSDAASDEEYVFYCHRPEWADVQPLLQDDGPDPVVRIAYTDRCE